MDNDLLRTGESGIGDQRAENAELSADEIDLLEWLARDDYGQYGECYGKTLDSLLAKGLAQIHPAREGQSGFIAKGDGLMYRAVSATEAGRAAIAKAS